MLYSSFNSINQHAWNSVNLEPAHTIQLFPKFPNVIQQGIERKSVPMIEFLIKHFTNFKTISITRISNATSYCLE